MMPADIRLPVGQIYPDPDRVFRCARRDHLDELTQSMAAVGLIHPVTVCREGLRWLLVCGERRLEAARRLGWERISARPIPYAPPALRSVIRAAENLHRNPFALIEMTDVVLSLKEAGMPAEVMARALGRESAWVQGLLAMARDPVARALLDADRLSSVEAWEHFMGLPPMARKRLLQSDEPVTSEGCARAGRGRRRRPPRSSPARHGHR
jgi:ParB/RepB/Spo0J family partition protein